MKNQKRNPRTILVLMSKGYTPQFDGISRYAREHSWTLATIDCQVVGDRLVHPDTAAPLTFAQLQKAWKPSGMIVDHAAASIVYAHRKSIHIPMVFPDRYPEDIGRDAFCVSCEATNTAEAAVDELFRFGYTDYAYIPVLAATQPYWSQMRAQAFKRRIEEAGCSFHTFTPQPPASEKEQHLVRWLKTIPKPCGILTANDAVANKVRFACQAARLRIPEDVALLGVDNRLDLCETSEPTLSSIQQDLTDCYYKASQLLDALIDCPTANPRKTPTFGVLRTVRRASTQTLLAVDARVKRALEFIRLHAAERLTPADVVSAMGCRRSYADQRFRECTGRSIVEEISLRRVELVKDELKNPEARLDDLPQACGFASAVDMRRVFKKLTGFSPREWRKRQ